MGFLIDCAKFNEDNNVKPQGVVLKIIMFNIHINKNYNNKKCISLSETFRTKNEHENLVDDANVHLNRVGENKSTDDDFIVKENK